MLKNCLFCKPKIKHKVKQTSPITSKHTFKNTTTPYRINCLKETYLQNNY